MLSNAVVMRSPLLSKEVNGQSKPSHPAKNQLKLNTGRTVTKAVEFEDRSNPTPPTDRDTPFRADELQRHRLLGSTSRYNIPNVRNLPDTNSSGGVDIKPLLETNRQLQALSPEYRQKLLDWDKAFFNILPVPGNHQETNENCGPSVVMSLLGFHDKKIGIRLRFKQEKTELQQVLARELNTGKFGSKNQGTRPQDIVRYLNHNGYEATLKKDTTLDEIKNEIAHNRPVIQLNRDWRGHYKLIIGLTMEQDSTNANQKETVVFMDPASHWRVVNSDTPTASHPDPRYLNTEGVWFNQESSEDYHYTEPNKMTHNVCIFVKPRS